MGVFVSVFVIMTTIALSPHIMWQRSPSDIVNKKWPSRVERGLALQCLELVWFLWTCTWFISFGSLMALQFPIIVACELGKGVWGSGPRHFVYVKCCGYVHGAV